MNSEAVEAFASKTMRPEALEAAKALVDQENSQPASIGSSGTEQDTPNNAPTTVTHSPSPPQGTVRTTHDINDDASRASTLLTEVIQGAKTVVDDALAWAEKKVGSLDLEKGGAGPYDSPATCMPSDLDAIASGILPAMPSKSQHDKYSQAKAKEICDTKSGEETDKSKG